MKRIATILIALCLWVVPAHAQTRNWIAWGDWGGYGALNPIGASSSQYLYPYAVSYPNCFAISTIANPPWDPNAAATDYMVTATSGSGCAGGGAPNPGQGIYVGLNQPHRALGIVQWIRLNGNITTLTYINRFNDCTHAGNTGVFNGCIDYADTEIDTSNKLYSSLTGTGSKSAALTLGTWYQYEHCLIAGTNGSGTVPSKDAAWLSGTNFVSNTTAATTSVSVGGGSGITIDYELGAGGTMDFGPFAIYDSGTACPASALATFYEVPYFPTSNGAVQFTAQANTNWQNVAASTLGSLSYNYDVTAGQEDIYNLSLGTHSNILFIGQRASVEKNAAGVRMGAIGYHIGSTDYPCASSNGFSFGNDTNQAYLASALQLSTYQSIMCTSPNDPSTSSAWSGTTDAGHLIAQVLQ
jgi:hypothetical protein